MYIVKTDTYPHAAHLISHEYKSIVADTTIEG